MKKHEMVLILEPNLTEEQEEAIIQKIVNKINEKGKVVGEIYIKEKRKLAYEIKGFKEGKFINLQFEMQTSLVKDIEILVRSNNTILKYIIVEVSE